MRWYGVMIAAGFMLAVFASVKMCKARGLDGDKLINLSLICFIAGVLGARLYYAALNPSYFLIHPGEILATWKGGLSIHGGLIGGIIAAILSWATWHSVGWAILHFFFGWLYVIYFVVVYGMPWWHLAPIIPQ